jgi:hypothetical protein
MPRCTSLDLDEAGDLLDDPTEGSAIFPFGKEILGNPSQPETSTEPGPSPAATAATEKRPGSQNKHSVTRQKYGGLNMPKNVKTLLKNNWPLLDVMKNDRWSNVLSQLKGAALSRSTWKKYGSALNLYMQFRTEMKLDKTLDLSERTLLSFAVWASEKKTLSGASVAAYISGLKMLAGTLGFSVEKTLPKSVALCLKGVKHRDSMRGNRQEKTAPFTFRILKR